MKFFAVWGSKIWGSIKFQIPNRIEANEVDKQLKVSHVDAHALVPFHINQKANYSIPSCCNGDHKEFFLASRQQIIINANTSFFENDLQKLTWQIFDTNNKDYTLTDTGIDSPLFLHTKLSSFFSRERSILSQDSKQLSLNISLKEKIKGVFNWISLVLHQ